MTQDKNARLGSPAILKPDMSKIAAVQARVRQGWNLDPAWVPVWEPRPRSRGRTIREEAGLFVRRETAGRRVGKLLREFSFPGSAASKDRARAAIWWMMNLVVAQVAFAWPAGLTAIYGTLRAQSGLDSHAGIGFLYATLFTLFCQLEGLYQPASRRNANDRPYSLLKAAMWALLVAESVIFFRGGSLGSVPLYMVASACLHCTLVAGVRSIRDKVLKNPARGAAKARRVVIIGTGRTALTLASHLRTRADLGRKFEGFLDDQPTGGAKTLGRVQDLERLAQTLFLDEIIVCLPDEPAASRRAVFVARRLKLDVKVVPEIYGCMPQNDGIEMAGDVPLLTLQEQGVSELGVLAKRVLDMAVAAGSLLLMAPALGVIALLVKLDSRGPALYCAPRVGKRGRHFLCYKFRTMRTDADKKKHALRVKNERVGPFFKLRNDPRVTRAGKWLRRYSLDELPQLWNVVRGDMSLVGPRPHPLDDHALYAPEHLQRLTVTPGLTGLWQITARNDPSFERGMALDREYIEKQSLRMDLWILFRTVREVALGNGV